MLDRKNTSLYNFQSLFETAFFPQTSNFSSIPYDKNSRVRQVCFWLAVLWVGGLCGLQCLDGVHGVPVLRFMMWGGW